MSSVLFPLLLVLYEMATYLSNDMYLPALPQITQEFMTTHAMVQLTLTAWFFGSVSLQLILGPISDRYGRRPVLLIGGLFFILSTMVCALAPNITTLLIARFIQGSTVCSVIVAGYASIHELYDQSRSIHILAWMASITVLAPAFGPLVGGLLLTVESWRFIFWVLVIWAIIAVALLYKYMPETGQKQSIHFKSLFKSYRLIFFNRDFLANTLPFCLLFCGMIVWIAAGPFLIISVFKHSPVMFGFLQTCIFSSFILGTRLVKYIMDKTSAKTLINIGLSIVLFAGLLIVLLTSIFPSSLSCFIVSMMIYAGASGLVFSPLQRFAIEASNEPMGARIAIFSTLMAGFGMLAGVLVSLFPNESLLNLAYMIGVMIVLACGIKWFTSALK